MWAYAKQKLSRGGRGAQNGEDDGGGGEGDVVVQVHGESDEVKDAVVAFTSESVAKHERELREVVEKIKSLAKDTKAEQARMEAMVAKHNEIIALRLIEGEEIDGDGTLVMAREPLTVFSLAEAKVCPRCCRSKRISRLHIPTGVVTRGAAQEVVVPNAAAGLAAAPLQQRQQVVTINPVGIAMQALSLAGRSRSASTKVATPPRDDSVAGEGGGGGAAANSGGERSDTMQFNRMVFDRLSAGAGGGGDDGISIREEGGDAARPRDGLPNNDGAAERSGEEEEVRSWI